jgi:4-hydroxy-tetrahydrodipicolinate synthase
MMFQGVIAALVTPFGDSGELDERGLRALVDRQIGDGVAGLVSCGTTGEFTSLTMDERRRVAEIVVEQAAGRVPVLAQTGSTSTATAARLSQHAEQIGAGGVLLAAPYYGSLSDDEIFGYYADVAAGVSVPVCLYNFPGATGVTLSVDMMLRLADEVENVRYVKDSSGDMTQLATLLTEHSDKITLLCGEELLLLPGLFMGLQGAVLGCSNILGPGVSRLFELAKAGETESLVRLHEALVPLMRFIVGSPYTATVKAALDLHGYSAGAVRKPLAGLDDGSVEELRALLGKIDPALLTGSGGASSSVA